MTEDSRAENIKLTSSRWEILRILNKAGHIGTTEGVILVTLRAIWVEMTEEYVRNQLDYLAKRGLVCLEKPPVKPWSATLSRHGNDVANYVVDCEDGIERPEKYW